MQSEVRPCNHNIPFPPRIVVVTTENSENLPKRFTFTLLYASPSMSLDVGRSWSGIVVPDRQWDRQFLRVVDCIMLRTLSPPLLFFILVVGAAEGPARCKHSKRGWNFLQQQQHQAENHPRPEHSLPCAFSRDQNLHIFPIYFHLSLLLFCCCFCSRLLDKYFYGIGGRKCVWCAIASDVNFVRFGRGGPGKENRYLEKVFAFIKM